jgi:hypothetical protein
MTMKAVGLGAATAIGFACLTAGAQAAPLSANSLKAETSTSSAVEKAAYRRCWWRHGVRVCRWVHDDYGLLRLWSVLRLWTGHRLQLRRWRPAFPWSSSPSPIESECVRRRDRDLLNRA